jgi:uncharacterized membrane protein YgaE (UPF0421/DUF939 family)
MPESNERIMRPTRPIRFLFSLLRTNVIAPLDLSNSLANEEIERSAERRGWFRRTVVTILAASSAWAIGSMFNGADALVATILVLVTLRLSLHASMNEAIGQLLGVAVGVLVAFATSEAFGASLISVGLIVTASLLLSRGLRLGDEGAVNIAITSLIVLGPGLETDTAVDRLIGTLIGVSVAVIASYFMQGTSPLSRTTSQVSQLHKGSAALLAEMANGLRGGYDLKLATVWLGRSRQLVSMIPELRRQAHEAIRYARWSPFAQSDDAEAAHFRFIEAEHTAVQVRTIARTLFDSVDKQVPFSNEVRNSLAATLESASVVIGRHRDVGLQDLDLAAGEAATEKLRSRLQRSTMQLLAIEDPAALTLTSSLITNVVRIADTLEGSTSAVTDVPVVSPEPGTTEKLFEAVTNPGRHTSSRKRRRANNRKKTSGIGKSLE